MYGNETDERPRDGDYRNDDERPQIVQLDPTDLTKDEVDLEIAKAKEGKRTVQSLSLIFSIGQKNVIIYSVCRSVTT